MNRRGLLKLLGGTAVAATGVALLPDASANPLMTGSAPLIQAKGSGSVAYGSVWRSEVWSPALREHLKGNLSSMAYVERLY